MSISFTGLASGLPINDIISQLIALERRPIDMMEQRKSTLEMSRGYIDNVEQRVKSLSTAIQKFTDGNMMSTMDLFKQKSAQSFNESVLTATAGADAVPQTLDVQVLTVATSSKSESMGSGAAAGNVGNLITGATKVEALANETGTIGKFSVFYDNNSYEIDVNAGEDINTVIGRIESVVDTGEGLNAVDIAIVGGKLEITSAGGGVVNVGANGDTSNFLVATQLDIGIRSGSGVGATLTSANDLSAIKTSGTLTDNSVNLQTAVTAGTFTVGEATFTIDANTTLDGLINQINADSDANVTASYNLRSNKIEFVSKDPGKKAITLQAGTSNFLSATNMITGTDTLSYQTLGDNARIQINGGAIIESSSNTVTSAAHGLNDLTFHLSNDSAGTDIQVTVKQNIDELADGVEEFVNRYNNVISYIDEQTNPDTGKLIGDSALIRVRNNLRKTVTDIIQNSPLISIASVGITTGSAGLEGDATSRLTFDRDTFLNTLQEKPDQVRSLFVGNETENITGLMENLEIIVDNVTDSTNGYFKSREDSINTIISDLTKSITKSQERLELKESLLKRQFAAMEQSISSLKSQSAYLGGQSASM